MVAQAYIKFLPHICVFAYLINSVSSKLVGNSVLSETLKLDSSILYHHKKSTDRNFKNTVASSSCSIERILQIRCGSDRSYGYGAEKRSPTRYDYDYDDRGDSRYYENGYRDDGRDPNGSRTSQERYGDGFYGEEDERRQYDDDRYYSDRHSYGREASRSSKQQTSSPLSNIPNVLRSGNKKIGMGMLAGGAVFTMLGISLFFNKSLMRLGNLLFITGIPMTIGPGRTMGYFLQPKKARATGCLILGIFLVMVGWPIFGIALEAFGLLNLFGNMFPVLMVILKQIPFVGTLLGGNNGGRKEKQRRSKKDEYYGDRYQNEDDNPERYY